MHSLNHFSQLLQFSYNPNQTLIFLRPPLIELDDVAVEICSLTVSVSNNMEQSKSFSIHSDGSWASRSCIALWDWQQTGESVWCFL